MSIKGWFSGIIGGSKETSTWSFPYFSGSADFRDWNTEDAIQKGFKSNTYAYRCVRIIAENVASVDWRVYKSDTDGDYKPESNHDMMDILNEPNNYMTWNDISEMIAIHLNLSGNAIVKKIRRESSDRAVIGLIPVSPDIVTPRLDEDGNIKDYLVVYGPKQREVLEVDDIIHFKFTNPANLYWGMSPLQAVSKVVDTDNEAIKWNKIAMQNRGVADGVFTVEEDLTAEQYSDIKKKIREQMQGSDNARGIILMSGGRMSWQGLSRSPAEMDFIESRKMNREEICAAFGVPPILAEIYDNAIYNNMKEAKYVLWQNTIIPILQKIREVLNNQLLKKDFNNEGYYLDFDLSNVPAMERSFKDKVENAERLFRMGIPLNQIIQELELGFDEIEGGDESYIPTNLMPTSLMSTEDKGEFNYLQKKTTNDMRELQWKRFEQVRLRYEDRMGSALERVIKSMGEDIADGYRNGLDSAINQVEKSIPPLQSIMKSTYQAIFEDIGQRTYDEFQKSGKKNYNPWNLAVASWVDDIVQTRSWMVSEAFKDDVTRIVRDAMADGQGPDKISRTLRQRFSEMSTHRGMRIARTETVAASNRASEEGAKAAGVTKKIWVSSRDDRVRDDHGDADGQEVSINSDFDVGGELLDHPGDPSGSPSNIINCRCTMMYQ